MQGSGHVTGGVARSLPPGGWLRGTWGPISATRYAAAQIHDGDRRGLDPWEGPDFAFVKGILVTSYVRTG